jgi:type VI secretion system protein ImpM
MTGAPGYYGKVVTHGDFVQRRLSADFVADWDHWLQAGLANSRLALGEQWRDTYLNCPMWRFALGPGLCGANGMAGVLLPGVDRVGRYFPLTLAASVRAVPESAWYAALEGMALDSVEPGFSLAALDAALVRLGPAPVPPHAQPLSGGSAFWTSQTMDCGPLCKVFCGMPGVDAFRALLAGQG